MVFIPRLYGIHRGRKCSFKIKLYWSCSVISTLVTKIKAVKTKTACIQTYLAISKWENHSRGSRLFQGIRIHYWEDQQSTETCLASYVCHGQLVNPTGAAMAVGSIGLTRPSHDL